MDRDASLARPDTSSEHLRIMIRPAHILSAIGVTTAVLGSVSSAHAIPDGQAINGSFDVFADGQWSRTNGRYEDRPSVTATWQVTSSCSTYLDCTGSVSSSQGWTADLTFQSGNWHVVHTVDRWLVCPDGSAYSAQQTFVFWPDPSAPSQYVGFDEAVGPSGACGVNQPLTIEMPLRMSP